MSDAKVPGFLISLEGGEGCGKSTQLPLICDALRCAGHEIVQTREPGGTPIGSQLRALLLDPEYSLSPEAELFLMEAARAVHVQDVIRPALTRGAHVITDRFTDSTMVYQGAMRGLSRDFIDKASRLATRALEPDLTILFDIDPTIGLARRRRAGDLNHFDKAPLDFHRQVRAEYLNLASFHPSRIVVIRADQPINAVLHDVLDAIRTRLGLLSAQAPS